MFLPSSTTILLLAALFFFRVSATPLRRQQDSTSPDSTQKIVENGIKRFLAKNNINLDDDGVHVLLPKGGMDPITFLASDGWMNDTDANNQLFNSLDQNQDPSSGSLIHMVDQYTNFVQEVNKAVGMVNMSDIEQFPEIAAASQAYKDACGRLADILTNSLSRYAKNGGDKAASITDDHFLRWAQSSDVDYQNGLKNCNLNKGAYQKVISEKLGNNYGLFASTAANVHDIINPGPAAVDGITMARRTGSGLADDTGAGLAVPYYRIPALDDLAGQWRQGMGLVGWEFTSEESTSHSDSSNTETSAHAGIQWGQFSASASASSSSSAENSLTENEKVTIKWGSMQLLNINRGAWFDDFRLASALRSPADDVAKQAQEAFTKYFGTSKEDAGPASIFNQKVIIGFQPTVEIEFSSEERAAEAQANSFSFDVGFLFFTAGGSHSEQSQSEDTKTVGNKLIFTDGSTNVYILGFVQKSFWDSQSALEAGDLSEM